MPFGNRSHPRVGSGSPSDRGDAGLSGAGRILRGVGFNLLGMFAPLVAALFAIPLVMRHLGAEAFAILNLCWIVLGYMAMFDLGLGRALARALAAGDEDEGGLVWTAVLLLGLLGIVAGGVLILATPLLIAHVIVPPDHLAQAATWSLWLIGLSMPAVTMGGGLGGILVARGRFGQIAAVRVPTGIGTYLAPAILAPFLTLGPLVAMTLAFRWVALVAHALQVRVAVPTLGHRPRFVSRHARDLLRIGGWMSVSALVGPVMVYLDRFLVAAMVPLARLPAYLIPCEIIARAVLLPGAVVGVLFPAFSAATNDPQRMARLHGRGLLLTGLLLVPTCAFLAALGPWLLHLWLPDPDISAAAAAPLRLLAFGLLLNGLAHVPFTLLQGLGRVRTTAVLHVVELPCFLALLGWLVPIHGVAGAAMAWCLRAGADAAVLMILVRRTGLSGLSPTAWLQMSAVVLMCALAAVPGPLSWIGLGAAVATAAGAAIHLMRSHPGGVRSLLSPT